LYRLKRSGAGRETVGVAGGRGPAEGRRPARHLPCVAGKEPQHDPCRRAPLPVPARRPHRDGLHRPHRAATRWRSCRHRFQDRCKALKHHQGRHPRRHPDEHLLHGRAGAVREAAGTGLALLPQGRQGHRLNRKSSVDTTGIFSNSIDTADS